MESMASLSTCQAPFVVKYYFRVSCRTEQWQSVPAASAAAATVSDASVTRMHLWDEVEKDFI